VRLEVDLLVDLKDHMVAIHRDHRMDHMAEDMFLSLDRGALTTTRRRPKASLHKDRMVAHREAVDRPAEGAVGRQDRRGHRARQDPTADHQARAEALQARGHRATTRPTHTGRCARQHRESQE